MIAEWTAWAIDSIPFLFNLLVLAALFVCLPLSIFTRTRPIAGAGFLAICGAAVILGIISLFVATVSGLGWIAAFALCLTGIGPILTGIYFTLKFDGVSGLIGLCVMMALILGSGFAAAKLSKKG